MDINLIVLICFIVCVILVLRFTGINESVDHSPAPQEKLLLVPLSNNGTKKVTVVVMYKWEQKARVTRECRSADDEFLQELGTLDDSKTAVFIYVNQLHDRYESWAEAVDVVTGAVLKSTREKIDPLCFADDDPMFQPRKKVKEVTVTKNRRVIWSGEITERELDDE